LPFFFISSGIGSWPSLPLPQHAQWCGKGKLGQDMTSPACGTPGELARLATKAPGAAAAAAGGVGGGGDDGSGGKMGIVVWMLRRCWLLCVVRLGLLCVVGRPCGRPVKACDV
jgi:hypothetical protein